MEHTLGLLVTIILPAACTLAATLDGAPPEDALAQWFAFWAVGVRMIGAGLNQMLRPRYITETIFGVADRKARGLAREIGFGNLALGTIGIGSLAFPGWVIPAAISGAVFYTLAAITQAMARKRTTARAVTMATDFAAGAALVVGAVWMQMEV